MHQEQENRYLQVDLFETTSDLPRWAQFPREVRQTVTTPTARILLEKTGSHSTQEDGRE